MRKETVILVIQTVGVSFLKIPGIVHEKPILFCTDFTRDSHQIGTTKFSDIAALRVPQQIIKGFVQVFPT